MYLISAYTSSMRLEATLINTTHPKSADTAFTVDGVTYANHTWDIVEIQMNVVHEQMGVKIWSGS